MTGNCNPNEGIHTHRRERAIRDAIWRAYRTELGLTTIIRQIDIVAPTDASVLLLGETGTGKELIAREILRRSHRKSGRLIQVNCSCVPKELFEKRAASSCIIYWLNQPESEISSPRVRA